MCRVVLGAFLALGLIASAGSASASGPDDTAWSRVQIGRGQVIWIASEDLHAGGGDHARARVLWTHPRGTNLPRGTRYTVSDYQFACDGGVEEQVYPYNAVGEPFAEREPTAEREVRRSSAEGAVFAMVCEGAEYQDDIELGSAREVLDYEASGRGMPQRSSNAWDQGPGQPDREPVEPREPGQDRGGQP